MNALNVKSPPMVVLRRGWLRWAEREVHASALARYDAMREVLRGRPWWRGLSGRWKRL